MYKTSNKEASQVRCNLRQQIYVLIYICICMYACVYVDSSAICIIHINIT